MLYCVDGNYWKIKYIYRRGIALLFLYHGTRRGSGVSVTPWLLFSPGKDPVPIAQEAGWAPGPVWRGMENRAPTGNQSLDHPACSKSLYQLRYLAHCTHKHINKYIIHSNTSDMFQYISTIFREIYIYEMEITIVELCS
jgi:hypothetical protein